MLLHRYIRLTPVFIVSMLSSEIISSLLDSSSVYELSVRDDLNCRKLVLNKKQLNLFFNWPVDMQILVAKPTIHSKSVSQRKHVYLLVVVAWLRYAVFCIHNCCFICLCEVCHFEHKRDLFLDISFFPKTLRIGRKTFKSFNCKFHSLKSRHSREIWFFIETGCNGLLDVDRLYGSLDKNRTVSFR